MPACEVFRPPRSGDTSRIGDGPSIAEYARDIVYNLMEVCDSEKVEHPIITSESGRAIVAHHSVLIVEAFGSIEKDKPPISLELLFAKTVWAIPS